MLVSKTIAIAVGTSRSPSEVSEFSVGRARARAISASRSIRAARSSQFLILSRFFDRFCRSRISRSAGKITRLGVCFMNRCKISGMAANAAPAASPAWISVISIGDPTPESMENCKF